MKTKITTTALAITTALMMSAPANAGPSDITCPDFEDALVEFERFQNYTRFGNTGIPGQVGEAIDTGEPNGKQPYADLTETLDMPRHIWNFTDSDLDDIRDRAEYCIATAHEWETDGDPSNEHRRIGEALHVIEKVYRGAGDVRENRADLKEELNQILSTPLTADNALQKAEKLEQLQERNRQVGSRWLIEQVMRPAVAHYDAWTQSLIADLQALDPQGMSGEELIDSTRAEEMMGRVIRLIGTDHVASNNESLYASRKQLRSTLGAKRDAFLETYVARTLPQPEDIGGGELELHAETLRAYANAQDAAAPLAERAPSVWERMEAALQDVVRKRDEDVAYHLCGLQLEKLMATDLDLQAQVFNGRRRFMALGSVACRIAGAGFDITIEEDYDAPGFDAPAILLRAETAYDRVTFGSFREVDFFEFTFVKGHPARPEAYQARYVRDDAAEGDLSRRAWWQLLNGFRDEIKMGPPAESTQ